MLLLTGWHMSHVIVRSASAVSLYENGRISLLSAFPAFVPRVCLGQTILSAEQMDHTAVFLPVQSGWKRVTSAEKISILGAPVTTQSAKARPNPPEYIIPAELRPQPTKKPRSSCRKKETHNVRVLFYHPFTCLSRAWAWQCSNMF